MQKKHIKTEISEESESETEIRSTSPASIKTMMFYSTSTRNPLPYAPGGFKSKLRSKYQVKKAFGMKLLSRDKLTQKNENSSKIMDDKSVAGAIRKVTSPIPVEDQKIESFLDSDVFTDPKCKLN